MVQKLAILAKKNFNKSIYERAKLMWVINTTDKWKIFYEVKLIKCFQNNIKYVIS